jgi:hypothetical protein
MFIEAMNIPKKVVRENETHILCPINFFPEILGFQDN